MVTSTVKYLMLFFAVVLTSCKPTTRLTPLKTLTGNDAENNPDQALYVQEVLELPALASEVTVIRVPEHAEPTALNEYVASYRYIPLETSEVSLVGSITKICGDDSLLIVFDRKNELALRYTDEGRFLGQLGQRGRGAGEYIDLCDVSLDRNRKEICLLDLTGGKQMFYGYDGVLLREQPLYYYYNRIEFLGDKQLLSTSFANNVCCPSIDAWRLVVADADQTPLYKAFSFLPRLREDFHWEAGDPLQVCGDKVFYNHVTSDTVWSVSPDGYRAEYVLDFGRPSVFPQKSDELLITDEEYQRIDESNLIFSSIHLQSRDVACFYLSDEERQIKPLLYSKRTGVILYDVSPGAGTSGLQSFFMSGVFNFVLNDTSFVYVLEPFQVLKWKEHMDKLNHPLNLNPEDSRMLDAMSLEDNPVLLVVDFKPF